MSNFYTDGQGAQFYPGHTFEYNGATYPAPSASSSLMETLGLTLVQGDEKPDPAYYVISGQNLDGTWTATARSLDSIKTRFKSQTKARANNRLIPTDWYVLRLMEEGITSTTGAIPADVSAYRSTIRQVSRDRCTAIDACTSIAEIQAVVQPMEPWPVNLQDSVSIYTYDGSSGY